MDALWRPLEAQAVIGDSIPWKEDLLRIASSLEQRMEQRRWTERTSFLVERDIMTGAYAVRKLSEARKLSDELAAETIAAQRHPLIGRPVDIWNRYEFYEQYEMENPEEVRLTLAEFVNQVIHSWVWMLSGKEQPPHLFDGVFVSSDRARKRHVYFFGAGELVETFRSIGLDDIVTMEMRRDTNGDMQIVRASREQ